MYCNSCGKQLAEDAAFCSSCGKRIHLGSQTSQEKDRISRSEPSPDLSREAVWPVVRILGMNVSASVGGPIDLGKIAKTFRGGVEYNPKSPGSLIFRHL